jgi:hypothetical protein
MPGRTDSLKLTLHRHCDNGSLVLPEVETGHPWDRGDVPLDAGKCWLAGKPVPLQRDAHSTGTTHHFRLGNDLEWSRSVRLIHAIPELPIIAIRDTFSGPRAAEPKILTFNLMAAGPVATPAGPMTPPERTHARESFTPGKAEDELPSAGEVFELPPGVHRLGFSGQAWKAHPAGGIDFDVYLSSDTAAQVHIGNLSPGMWLFSKKLTKEPPQLHTEGRSSSPNQWRQLKWLQNEILANPVRTVQSFWANPMG